MNGSAVLPSSTLRIRVSASVVYGLFASVGCVAYFLAGRGSDLQAAIYECCSLAAPTAVLIGIRRHHPRRAHHWWFMFGALALWALGDSYWDFYRWVLGGQAPYPSPADVAYIGAYPVFLAGVFALTRGWGRPRLGDILDAIIVAVAGGALSVLVLVAPMFTSFKSIDLGALASLAAPVGDLLLLVGVTQLLFRTRARNTAVRCVTAALIATLVADAVYSYLQAKGVYESGMPVDAGWLIAYGLWGIAALHPSMARMDARVDRRGQRLSVWRIALLVSALLVAPVALTVQSIMGTHVNALELGIVAIVSTFIVAARVVSLQREGVRAEAALAASEQEYRDLFREADRARHALAARNEELRELDSLKDELIALVSHELRTPLTSITGYVELVLDDPTLHDDHRNFLRVVERNTDRLLLLVSDLLFVAQAQAGRLRLNRDTFEMADLVADAVTTAQPRADDGDVTLTISRCDSGELVGDRQRIGQVIDNLLSNAVKFTPPSGRVDLSLSMDGRGAHLQVSDTGIGMSRRDQDHLFERFFRSKGATKNAIQGTGLGLSIVKTIVDAHGGTIAVESTEGRGTTVRVDFPSVPTEKITRMRRAA